MIHVCAEVTLPESYTIETVRCKLRCVSLEDIPHVFSATRYEGFNDGMLWDPPENEEELVEPHRNSIEAWREDKAYGFTRESRDILQKTSEPKSEDAPDNLFEPISGFDRVEGDFSFSITGAQLFQLAGNPSSGKVDSAQSRDSDRACGIWYSYNRG